MSLTPAEPPPPASSGRHWTLPVVIGAVAAVLLLLAVCLVGGAAAFVMYRHNSAPATSRPPIAAPSLPAWPPPAQQGQSGPQCLIGEWLEVSYASWADIYGAHVQLTGKGEVLRYGADGVAMSRFDNLVRAGVEDGDSYEVIFNGVTQANYQADATTIYYSNPRTEGTTTWKINGRVRTSEQISLTLAPDTYKCQGNDLRLYSEDYAAEFQRILPPGVPV